VPAGRVVHAPDWLDWQRLLRRNAIGNLTAMVDTARLGRLVQPDRPGAEDWALWLDVLRRTQAAGRATAVPYPAPHLTPYLAPCPAPHLAPGRGLDEVLAVYRAGGGHSARRVRAARAVWSVLRDQGLTVPRALPYWLSNLARGLADQRI
jgi:hypothetical protein